MNRRVRRGRFVVFVVALLIGVALMRPAIAWAHARLTRSEPAPNAQLPVSPTVIRLWFSEAPELVMTRIGLRDSAGSAVDIGPVERGDSKLGLKARLHAPLAPGRYVVSWRTAAADGHPSQGTFAFAVRPSAVPSVPPAAVAPTVRDTTRHAPPASETNNQNATEPTALTPAYIAARALGFMAMLIVIGIVVFRVAVVARATGLTDSSRRLLSERAATIGLYAALTTLAAAAIRLYLQSRMMNGDAAADIAHLRTMTMETQWGLAWLLQGVAAVSAAVAFWLVRRGWTHAWALAGIAAVTLAISPALGGHAIASPEWTSVSVLADGLHVLGASGWLGSLLCVAVIGLPVALAEPSERRWETVASLVNAFSPTALGFAALVALTGLASAWLRLGALSPLWTSTYGRVLLVKLALLAGVAATGAYNWLRVRPSLGTEPATRHFRRSAATELTIGFLVVVVTAILVATPTPIHLR